MKVKDLIETLKKLDPETVVNYADYVLDMPDYYDGTCVEVGPSLERGDMKKMTIRRGTRVPKLNFYNYDFEDYFFDAGYEGLSFEEAYGLIDFQVDSMGGIDRQQESWHKSYDSGVQCAVTIKEKYPEKKDEAQG